MKCYTPEPRAQFSVDVKIRSPNLGNRLYFSSYVSQKSRYQKIKSRLKKITSPNNNHHPSIYRQHTTIMGVAKKTRKFGANKRIIGKRDARLAVNKSRGEEVQKKKEDEVTREMYMPLPPSSKPILTDSQSPSLFRPLLPT